MTSEQQRVLTAFRRILNFVQARPQLTAADSAEGTALGQRIAALAIVVNRLTQAGVQQLTELQLATRVDTDEPRIKADLIRLHLGSIVKVARSLRGTVPGIGMIRMPNINCSSQALLNQATSVADAAAIYATVLTEHALPSTAIADLRSAIDAYRAKLDARGSARANVVGLTRQLTADVKTGRMIVQGLDGSISRMLYGNPAELAAWRAARRVAKGSGTSRFAVTSSQIGDSPAVPAVVSIQSGANATETGVVEAGPAATTDQRAA